MKTFDVMLLQTAENDGTVSVGLVLWILIIVLVILLIVFLIQRIR